MAATVPPSHFRRRSKYSRSLRFWLSIKSRSPFASSLRTGLSGADIGSIIGLLYPLLQGAPLLKRCIILANNHTIMEVFLGTKQGDKTVVTVPADVRRKHMAVFGKSG